MGSYVPRNQTIKQFQGGQTRFKGGKCPPPERNPRLLNMTYIVVLLVLQLMLLYGFARFNADPEAVKCVEYFHQLTPQVLQLSESINIV